MNAHLNSPKIILAPMRGFTDVCYRNTYSRYFTGIDLALAPFVPTVSATPIKPFHLKGLLPEQNQRLPIIPQLLGNVPQDFIRMARALADLGYHTVNWNLGCPYPMVARKCKGAGLLAFPDRIDAFLEQCVAAMPNRLSIKVRLGIRSVREISALIPVFNRYPLAEVIIHPRTALQRYTGRPDLEAFAATAAQLRHTVVYNGDIDSLEAYQRTRQRLAGVRCWMIGRGVLANPFLPAIIKSGKNNIPAKVATMHGFHDALFDEYSKVLQGPGHLIGRMRGHWGYLARAFINGDQVRKKINKTNKISHYRDIVGQFFTQEAQWKNAPSVP